MKKILLLMILLIIPCVKAESELPMVNKYINHVAYFDDEKVCDTWAYDITVKKYVKLNSDCTKILELTNPNDDPTADHGKVSIKATVPDDLIDETIIVQISTIPYDYQFELNKDNNFTVEEEMIATSYSNVYIYVNNHEDEYEVLYPKNMNVYKGETSSIKLDYSKYGTKKTKKEEKKEKKTNYTLYIIIGIFGLIFFFIAGLYLKARNI